MVGSDKQLGGVAAVSSLMQQKTVDREVQLMQPMAQIEALPAETCVAATRKLRLARLQSVLSRVRPSTSRQPALQSIAATELAGEGADASALLQWEPSLAPPGSDAVGRAAGRYALESAWGDDDDETFTCAVRGASCPQLGMPAAPDSGCSGVPDSGSDGACQTNRHIAADAADTQIHKFADGQPQLSDSCWAAQYTKAKLDRYVLCCQHAHHLYLHFPCFSA